MSQMDLLSPTDLQHTAAPSHASARVQNGASANSPAAQKLRKAAAEFESMLLTSLWKSMKGSFEVDKDQSGDPAHDTLDDLGVQSMCGALGKAGGLGLGKLILKHLEPILADSQNGNFAPSSKAFKPSADTSVERR
jgi:Rod binding domain-containing protein